MNNRSIKLFLYLSFLSSILVAFQNCSDAAFREDQSGSQSSASTDESSPVIVAAPKPVVQSALVPAQAKGVGESQVDQTIDVTSQANLDIRCNGIAVRDEDPVEDDYMLRVTILINGEPCAISQDNVEINTTGNASFFVSTSCLESLPAGSHVISCNLFVAEGIEVQDMTIEGGKMTYLVD